MYSGLVMQGRGPDRPLVSRRRGDRDGGRGRRCQDLVQVGDAEVDAGAQHDARLRPGVVTGLFAGKNHGAFIFS